MGRELSHLRLQAGIVIGAGSEHCLFAGIMIASKAPLHLDAASWQAHKDQHGAAGLFDDAPDQALLHSSGLVRQTSSRHLRLYRYSSAAHPLGSICGDTWIQSST